MIAPTLYNIFGATGVVLNGVDEDDKGLLNREGFNGVDEDVALNVVFEEAAGNESDISIGHSAVDEDLK